MTGMYDRAVKALATLAYKRYSAEYQADHLSWRDFAADASAYLHALADEGVLNHYLVREMREARAAQQADA